MKRRMTMQQAIEPLTREPGAHRLDWLVHELGYTPRTYGPDGRGKPTADWRLVRRMVDLAESAGLVEVTGGTGGKVVRVRAVSEAERIKWKEEKERRAAERDELKRLSETLCIPNVRHFGRRSEILTKDLLALMRFALGQR